MKLTLEELQALYNPDTVSLYTLLLSHHEIQKRKLWSQTKYQKMKEEKQKAPPPTPSPPTTTNQSNESNPEPPKPKIIQNTKVKKLIQ